MKCFKSTFVNYLPILGLAAMTLSSCVSSGPASSNYLTGLGGTVHQQTSGGTSHPAPAIPDDVSYWDGGGANGSPVTSYTAACTSTNGGLPGAATAASGPITVTGLTATKTYTCTAYAHNARGDGLRSLAGPAVVA